MNPERTLGSGALAGVLGMGLPGFEALPPDVRSAVWGAIGAALVGLVARGGAALGDVIRASGRRVAVWIHPADARTAPPTPGETFDDKGGA